MVPTYGLKFLLQSIPRLLLPSLLTYGTLYALEKAEVLILSPWGVAALVLVAKPAQFFLNRFLRPIHNQIKATRRGARVAPHIEEPWPYFGGIFLVKHLVKSFVTGYVLETVPESMKKYGNAFELRLPTETVIFTTEPEHVKAILATQFEDFEKGERSTIIMDSLLGTGVFNSDGDMWRFHRQITRPFFTRERISDFDIFDKHAEEALSLAKGRLGEGFAFDFQDLVARFTLDSAGQFLFGGRIDALHAGIPYPHNSGRNNPESFHKHTSNTFVNAFAAGLKESSMRFIRGQDWPLWEIGSDSVKPHRDIIDSVMDPIVAQVLKDNDALGDKQGAGHTGEGQTLLAHLAAQTQNPTIIKDELINLLLAGRDTTACTLTFSAYMLTQHPHITDRLRSEVLQTVGDSGRPSYDDIRDMKYLRAFINEVLRLYPPVPSNARTAVRDTLLTTKDGAKPLYISKGTSVAYAVWSMHRRKDLWGPDAEEFDPDRFLDERLHKYLTPNPFIFTPFNAGPRICLGQQFAYHEVSFFLVRLLQQFSKLTLDLSAQPLETHAPPEWAELEGTQGREKLRPKVDVTLSLKGGLWVRME